MAARIWGMEDFSRLSFGLDDGTTLIGKVTPPLTPKESWEVSEITSKPPRAAATLKTAIEVWARSSGKTVTFERLTINA